MTKAAVSKLEFELDKYTEFGVGYGSYFLRNYYQTGGTGGDYYVPLHLYDVTAVNNADTTNTVRQAQVGYRLVFDDPTEATAKWRTLGPALESVQSPATFAEAASTVRASSLLRAVRAKILFYSTSTIPTRVRVALVQIREDYMHPSKNAVGGDVLSHGIYQADNTLLPTDTGAGISSQGWNAIVGSYCRNPVRIGNGNSMGFLKVLKSESFTLTPKETTDATAATYHMVDMFYEFNRIQKYNWMDSGAYTLSANDAAPINRGQNRCCVSPRARVYLMIMADGKYATAATEPPADDSARSVSYDIDMKMYHHDIV